MSIPAPHIFSFFSGAGFLDLGFEKSGFNVSLVNEIHEPFVLAYKYSREQMKLPEPMFGYIVDSIDNSLTNVGIEELKAYANAARAEGAPLGFIGGLVKYVGILIIPPSLDIEILFTVIQLPRESCI